MAGRTCGQHGVADRLKTPRARRQEGLDRPRVHPFHRLGVELPEHARRVDGEGEDARQGAEPHGGDEHQGEDQLVDATHGVQDPGRPRSRWDAA